MRIDSHQHFWQYQAADYPWISDAMTVLRRDFLPNDLAPLLKSIQFDGSIAVQARQTLAETEWLLQLADSNSMVRGVVGWVDLRSPQLHQQLQKLAPHPKLVGVRHVVQDEPDDEFMLRPDFHRGIAQLRGFDLTYDLLLFPRHLRAAAKLVKAFPEQRFVLDHIAKPRIREGKLAPWDADMQQLAQYPNVFCKLSGMVTEAGWNQWRDEDFRPYLEIALKSFGPERLMIGSDWPVCTVSGDYVSTMRIVMDHIQALSATEQAAILGDNCLRFYGLAA